MSAARIVVSLSLLLAPAALAQQGTGASVSPSPLAAGRPAAPTVAEGVEDPATLIRMAEAVLAERRLREATELLERAEARLLTRSELASEADRPAVGGAIGELAAARDAIGRRDAAGAAGLLASARARLERGEAPSIVALPAPPATTGAPVPPTPAWGGGPPPATYAPLPGIAPQNMPAGGFASPAVPIGPDTEIRKPEPLPGAIPPASTKAPW
jgi:hypothetical protein